MQGPNVGRSFLGESRKRHESQEVASCGAITPFDGAARFFTDAAFLQLQVISEVTEVTDLRFFLSLSPVLFHEKLKDQPWLALVPCIQATGQ